MKIKYLLFGIQRFLLQIWNKECKMKEEEAKRILNKKRSNGYKRSKKINRGKEFETDVSIIVPVYNAEKYIGKCIESVIRQETRYNFELLLINDGSTDNSLKIMQSYLQYKFVKIINQDNRGFSGARNRGLDEANGNFIMFLDADDMLEVNAIEILMEKEKETGAEIIEAGFSYMDQNGIILSYNNTFLHNEVTSKKEDILKAAGFFWNKLYNRTVFDNIRLPEGVLFEDTLLNMIIYPLCKSMFFLDEPIYLYRINNEGISHTHIKGNRSIDTYYVVEVLLNERKRLGLRMDDLDYKFLMWQLCVPTLARIACYSEEIKMAVFILSASLIKRNKVKCSLNYHQKIMESAYLNRNYLLWKTMAKFNYDKIEWFAEEVE